jgi:hypothetical protein
MQQRVDSVIQKVWEMDAAFTFDNAYLQGARLPQKIL